MGSRKKSARKKQQNKSKAVRIAEVQKRSALESVVVNIISLLVFIAFGYIAIVSFFQTSVIDPDKYSGEHILYEADNIGVNLLLIVLFTLAVFVLNRHFDFFAKVNMLYMEVGLFVFVAVLGLIWIFSVTSIPAADSGSIYETATQAAKGNYNSLYNGATFYNSDYYNGLSYYNCFPYQLGFVFICEIIYRIFGTASSMPVQVVNVLCLAAAYLALAKITKLLFKRRSVEFISIIMLAGCIQPILFCTFVYGNIIGMCCAIWASYFLIKYFQSSRYIYLLPCGVLLVVSNVAKYNNMIYLAAFVVMLVIHTVKDKKWQSIAFALAICVAVSGAGNLVTLSYEKRADTEFPNGVSQVLSLDMGLNECNMAPGWYNGIALSLYKNNGGNLEAAEEQAKQDISKRLDAFADDPGYALDFFNKKITSQWNETTFESIWISKVKSHSSEPNALGNSVYNGGTGSFLEYYFNFYMMIIYILFAAGLVFLFKNKKLNIETVLLPLVLLGGFGYHLLFEAKSQYAITYIVLLIPTAAYSLSVIMGGKYTRLKALIKKAQTVPDENAENINQE